MTLLTTPQQKLSAENVAAGLKEFHGNLAAVARKHGVSRQAVWLYIQRHQSLQAIQRDTKESIKDNAESALHAAVLRGEPWAVKWYLACQAKDRGYVERQEVTGKDGEGLASIEAIVAALQRAKRGGPSSNGDGAEARGNHHGGGPLPG